MYASQRTLIVSFHSDINLVINLINGVKIMSDHAQIIFIFIRLCGAIPYAIVSIRTNISNIPSL